MATKEDIRELKKSIQELRKGQLEILLKLEALQEKIDDRHFEAAGNSKEEPEPILTCVQCSTEYQESKNAEGSCHYHKGTLRGSGWEFKYTCCGKGAKNYKDAKAIGEGCTKGKHRSVHHTDYTYAKYIFYMQEQSEKAKELWIEMDIGDLVTEKCLWAEVGKTEDDSLFIIVGTACNVYSGIATCTCEELKTMTGKKVVLEMENEIGWKVRAEVSADEKLILVSLKPASTETALVKQIRYQFDDSNQLQAASAVKCISDPSACKSSTRHATVPEDIYDGPRLELGEDYSKNRKNDYEAETTGSCPLKLQQVGNTEVYSTTRLIEGKWKNMFACKTKVTNTGKENISVTDVYGYYRDSDSEWIKVDNVAVGRELFRGNYEWFDTSNFWLNAGTTGSLQVQLAINREGTPPESNYEGRRADSSLPQPLYLKFTFVDQNSDSATLQFEQGNQPLDLATRESRTKNWAGNDESNMLLWSFADDTTCSKRSDVAIYKLNENGLMAYRPAVLGNGGQYFYIERSLDEFGYKAKTAGQPEFEITEWKKESKGSSITPFAMVDLESGTTYGIKVVIETPTSKAVSYYLLSPVPPADSNVLTVKESNIRIKGEVIVNWRVYKASKSDRLVIYPLNGKSSVSSAVYNKSKLMEGEAKLKGPDKPGEYEVRYYPAWLNSSWTIYRHDVYIASARFSVTAN